MREKLSSRERVITAIDHREPDRLPIQFYATPEVRKLLIDYFKRQSLEEILEVDFRGIESRYLGKLKKSIPGSGIDAYDMWGVGYRNCPYHLDVMGAHMDSISVSGTYPEPVYMPFAGIKTMDEVAAYPWPNPDDFDYSVIEEQIELSPEMFDAVLRPRYQKLIDLTHKYGAKAWFHSCGSTYFLHSRFIDMDLVLCNINF